MSDATSAHETPGTNARLLLTAGLGAALVFVMYFACPPRLSPHSTATKGASEDGSIMPEAAPPFPPIVPEARLAAPAPAKPQDSASGWPKPGDPLLVPQGTVSPSGAPAVPVTRFDAVACQACLSETCAAELAAGGDLDDALHMIGCTRLADEQLCVRGAEANRLTRIAIPPLPSGELTDATRALIACGTSCPCWTKSAAP